MRITYGKIKGYKPSDAVVYEPFTYLDGVMEKYIPGDYEFDVPKKLIELYNAKDYGKYGVNGKMPVAFIATNHTTGGNSGSPALDAKGNLIGLNFGDLQLDMKFPPQELIENRLLLRPLLHPIPQLCRGRSVPLWKCHQ